MVNKNQLQACFHWFSLKPIKRMQLNQSLSTTIQIWRYKYLTKISNVSGNDQLIKSCPKNHQRFCFCQRACLPHLNIAPSPFLTFLSNFNLPSVSGSVLEYLLYVRFCWATNITIDYAFYKYVECANGVSDFLASQPW